VDDSQFVQKGDSFENLHIPEDYSFQWDFLISRLMLLNDHIQIAVCVKIGDDASLERKLKVLDVIDHVTALVFQRL
jgi:hypothetical protein